MMRVALKGMTLGMRNATKDSDTHCSNLEEQILKNRRTWELAKESGAMLLNEEDDFMGDGKIRMVRDLKNKHKVDLLGLIETKRQIVTKFYVARIWGQDGAGWEYVSSNGASGGLLLIWDESVFKIDHCYKGERWLCVEGVLVKSCFNCVFFLVYGAHSRDAKIQMWEELSYMAGLCQVPGCYMGDFNKIIQVEERQGTAGRSCSKIDRALVSLEWLEKFFETRLRGGSRGLLDHCPIIVEDKKLKGGPRPFRSLHSWFTHEGFLRMVKEEWRGLGEMQFTDKLKALTVSLGRWHRANFGEMDKKITKFEKEIKKIDDMVSKGVYDGTMEARRKALVTCCERWYVRKEVHWKQMSRSRQAKDMDKNTRFFHNIASARKRNNRIDTLLINGRLVRNQARIKLAIRDFYKDLYHQENSHMVGFRDGLVTGGFKYHLGGISTYVHWARGIKELRPISMVGCVYKVISNVLVRRMRSVLPVLVGETQSVFVKGRKIHDGALIACETVNWLKLRKKEAAIIKLDFQKSI
ncbi:uncharacterized protein [Arachis hypogaea]|uniref:uncharacterized protein n=1 Tax=Arachis hypogaea TaxID=3818 RepID=UPI003B21FDE0